VLAIIGLVLCFTGSLALVGAAFIAVAGALCALVLKRKDV